MTQLFADNAAQLAGAVGRLLGWPPDWFWRSTPAEIAAILAPPGGEPATVTRDKIAQLMKDNPDG